MWKELLGALATLMALVAYIFYLRDILAGRTKPHAFTWLVWASLTLIAFVAQVQDGGGPGSWVTGFTALASFGFFGLALARSDKQIVRADWLCLAAAVVASVLWVVTDNAFLAVLLVSIIDAIGFVPTFRKSWTRPYEETLATYAISGLKFVVAIVALEHFSAVTAFYPASLVLMNLVFVGMLMVRRAAVPRAYVASGALDQCRA